MFDTPADRKIQEAMKIQSKFISIVIKNNMEDFHAKTSVELVGRINIGKAKLPLPETVAGWSSRKFVDTMRHDQKCGDYNINVRQLLHVGYLAVEPGIKVCNRNRSAG